MYDSCWHFSDIDFDGATVGLAYVGTLCTDSSTGVIQVPKTEALLYFSLKKNKNWPMSNVLLYMCSVMSLRTIIHEL